LGSHIVKTPKVYPQYIAALSDMYSKGQIKPKGMTLCTSFGPHGCADCDMDVGDTVYDRKYTLEELPAALKVS